MQVALDTIFLDEALSESLKRGDAGTCRQLYQLVMSLSILKSVWAFEMWLTMHSSDATMMCTLLEEIISEGSDVAPTEDLSQTFLSICVADMDAKLQELGKRDPKLGAMLAEGAASDGDGGEEAEDDGAGVWAA